jgi:hypothetical protein
MLTSDLPKDENCKNVNRKLNYQRRVLMVKVEDSKALRIKRMKNSNLPGIVVCAVIPLLRGEL